MHQMDAVSSRQHMPGLQQRVYFVSHPHLPPHHLSHWGAGSPSAASAYSHTHTRAKTHTCTGRNPVAKLGRGNYFTSDRARSSVTPSENCVCVCVCCRKRAILYSNILRRRRRRRKSNIMPNVSSTFLGKGEKKSPTCTFLQMRFPLPAHMSTTQAENPHADPPQAEYPATRRRNQEDECLK